MTSLFVSVAVLMLSGASPEEPALKVLKELARHGNDVKAAAVVPYLDPKNGLVVDSAPEGSTAARWVTITKANVDQHFAKVLLPMFQEGLFKATPGCKRSGDIIACSLMTPTSMPRTLEFIVRDGSAYMHKLYWSPADEGDGDDDLPM